MVSTVGSSNPVVKIPTEVKKRIDCEHWNFSYDNNKQIELINNLDESNTDNVTKTIIQQINHKISGYKQQDKKKGVFIETEFIDAVDAIESMRNCNLRCHYCTVEMHVLYDTARESKQWTVDRIDNDKGHNRGNYHLACLECNLKRRRTNDDKFLLSKSTFQKVEQNIPLGKVDEGFGSTFFKG
jgi:hypothetical protein